MTTYTAIANGAVDAGSPIDESLVTALRDNPIAITEGASGAPTIQTAAYAAGSVDAAAIGAGAVTSAKISANTGTPAAGDVAIASGFGIASAVGNVISFTVNIAGTYRVRATVFNGESSGSGTLQARILNGASTLGTSATATTTTPQSITVSAAFSAGDVINIATVTVSSTWVGVISASVGCDSTNFVVGRVAEGMTL